MGISFLLMLPVLVKSVLFLTQTEGGLLLVAALIVGLIPSTAWLGFNLIREALSSPSA